MLTGGLHDRILIAYSLRARVCDLVGIGRPACLAPTLPRDILLNRNVHAEEARIGGYEMRGSETMRRLLGGGQSFSPSTSKSKEPIVASYAETETTPLVTQEGGVESHGIPLIGAGVSTYWHEWQLCRIGRGKEADEKMDWLWGGLIVEGIWWGILKGGFLGWWNQ